MSTYASLELNRFYLVRENENEELILVQPVMQTSNCILLLLHSDNAHTSYWRKKSDNLLEIADELTDEELAAYENVFDAANTEVYEVGEDADEDDWDEQ